MKTRQFFAVRPLIKTVLIFAALAFDARAIAARVAMLGVSPELLFYGALFAGLVVCLWCAAFIRQPVVRWGWGLVFAVATVVVGSFEAATDDAMSYDAFVTMVHSAGFAGDAVAQYGRSIAGALTAAVMLLIGVGLSPGLRGAKTRGRFFATAMPFLGLVMLALLMFFRGGEGGRGLPTAWVGTSYSALFAVESLTSPRQDRRAVDMAVDATAPGGDIVLIIDESIAGRYLDINDAAGVRSGLASPPPGVSVANFGLAASITNCSYGTNLTLRHGGTRAQYRAINASMPSIFAYAKRAGFTTRYIDAQRVGGAFQNGMDDSERRAIDHFVQFGETPVVDRDMAAATALIAALNNDRRDFILVNKMGAHFPVSDKYPVEDTLYRPALARDANALVTEVRMPEGVIEGSESWRRYRNAYRNTLAWTVGGFFDRLFAQARLDGALIIYTSDHGQNLHERGGSGTTTHCSASPAAEEGAVPLVVIDTAGAWLAAAQRNFDASSHYRIFPTLLTAMGYDAAAVQRRYGDALDSPAPDPTSFNSRFNARLGRGPQWTEVRRDQIASPPRGDYVPMPR